MTPNDAGDADTGPNALQNFPIVKTVTPGASTTNIQGILNSRPSTTFDIDLFSNPVCVPRPQGYVQGETYLGSVQVTTDGAGDATFATDVPFVLQPGQNVAATATDPAGNTSEFSQRIIFSLSPASGPPAGGTNVTIAGMLFENGANISVGGTLATSVVVVNPNSMTATMPARPAGSLNNVTVTNPSGIAGTLLNGWVADFLDVTSAQQFYFYITKLVANEITVGCGGGNYCRSGPVTRQQMAVFLLKSKHGVCYARRPAGHVFADVPVLQQLLAVDRGTGGGRNHRRLRRRQLLSAGRRHAPADGRLPVEVQARLELRSARPATATSPTSRAPATPSPTGSSSSRPRASPAAAAAATTAPPLPVRRDQMAAFLYNTFQFP